jgi:hypothetical protein
MFIENNKFIKDLGKIYDCLPTRRGRKELSWCNKPHTLGLCSKPLVLLDQVLSIVIDTFWHFQNTWTLNISSMLTCRFRTVTSNLSLTSVINFFEILFRGKHQLFYSNSIFCNICYESLIKFSQHKSTDRRNWLLRYLCLAISCLSKVRMSEWLVMFEIVFC